MGDVETSRGKGRGISWWTNEAKDPRLRHSDKFFRFSRSVTAVLADSRDKSCVLRVNFRRSPCTDSDDGVEYPVLENRHASVPTIRTVALDVVGTYGDPNLDANDPVDPLVRLGTDSIRRRKRKTPIEIRENPSNGF